jgi:hypothetical protein
MPRYEMVSGIIFGFISIAQLTRAVLGWRLQVNTVSIPISASVIAFLVMGGLSVWAFRSVRRTTSAGV